MLLLRTTVYLFPSTRHAAFQVKDCSFGAPTGTYKLKHRSSQKVSKVQDLADSKTEERGQQAIKDMYNARRGRLAVTVSPDGEEGAL